MTRTTTIKTLSAFLLVGSLGLSACGSESPPSTPIEDVTSVDAGQDGGGTAGATSEPMVDETSDPMVDENADTSGDTAGDTGGIGEWDYQDEDGSYQVGGDISVPADFPSEVPLPSGDWTLAASYVSDADYTLTYSRTDASPADCEVYFSQFDGWTEEMRSSMEGTMTAIFSNDAWTVIIGCDTSTGMTVSASSNAG